MDAILQWNWLKIFCSKNKLDFYVGLNKYVVIIECDS